MLASTATSPGVVGHLPLTSLSGLKRCVPSGLTLRPSPGALPCETTFPFAPMNWAVPPTEPAAAATPGSCWIRVSVAAGNDGAAAPLKAGLPVTTASAFA